MMHRALCTTVHTNDTLVDVTLPVMGKYPVAMTYDSDSDPNETNEPGETNEGDDKAEPQVPPTPCHPPPEKISHEHFLGNDCKQITRFLPPPLTYSPEPGS